MEIIATSRSVVVFRIFNIQIHYRSVGYIFDFTTLNIYNYTCWYTGCIIVVFHIINFNNILNFGPIWLCWFLKQSKNFWVLLFICTYINLRLTFRYLMWIKFQFDGYCFVWVTLDGFGMKPSCSATFPWLLLKLFDGGS